MKAERSKLTSEHSLVIYLLTALCQIFPSCLNNKAAQQAHSEILNRTLENMVQKRLIVASIFLS